MIPIITSVRTINSISDLTKRKNKIQNSFILRKIRKRKLKEINNHLNYHWGLLYEFYPELKDEKDIHTFEQLFLLGKIKPKYRSAIIGSQIYNC